MKRGITGILFGILFIFFAVLIIGNAMGFLNIENFNGWWTAFIIIPGISWMISYGIKFWNVLITLLGIWLLFLQRGWYIYIEPSYIIALLLLALGVYLIYKSVYSRMLQKRLANNSSWVNSVAVFSKMSSYNNSSELKGGSIISVFGGITLDLRNAKIVDNAIFEVTGIVGGATILLPQNCELQISGIPFLGGIQNRFKNSDKSDRVKVIIKYTAIFSGIELK